MSGNSAEVPLVQATATAAAQSAAAALEEVRRAQTASLATKPKELELTGRPEEDRRLWADWRFAATQFLASKDGAYLTEIPQAIAAADPIDLRTMVQDRQQRARLLFTYLCGSVKGRLLAMLREPTLASAANGFEAIRLFHRDVEAEIRRSSLGAVGSYPDGPKGTNLRDAIVAVERLFSDYEATSSEKLSNHIKIAALTKMLPPEMRVHVNMQIRDNTTYEDLKKTVTEYEVAERRYNPLAQNVYDHQGPALMEVDQIQQDGGKGKKGGNKSGKEEKKRDPLQCVRPVVSLTKESVGTKAALRPMEPERVEHRKAKEQEPPKVRRFRAKSAVSQTTLRISASSATKTKIRTKGNPKVARQFSRHRRPLVPL